MATSSTPIRIAERALLVTIAAGVVLACLQFALNRSVWLDEARIGLNMMSRSYAGLLAPLDYNQVAPIGFLMVMRLFVDLLGPSEFALRLLPLLSYLAALPLLFRLARALTGERLLALAATAFFAINWVLIYYASEVKQYSTEALACILVLLVTVRCADEGRRPLVVAGIVGALAVWFSSTAVIVLTGCGLWLLGAEVARRRRAAVLLPLVAWGASFAVYYASFIHGHPHQAFMLGFWAGGFFPISGPLSAQAAFVLAAVERVNGYFMGHGPLWFVPAAVSLVGLIGLAAERRGRELALFAGPILIHFALSAFRLYPFQGRLLLYLMPIFILAYVIGIWYAWRAARRILPRLPVALVALPVLVTPYVIATKFPMERYEFKKSLAVVVENFEPGENLYVNEFAQCTFDYYRRRDDLFPGVEVVFGSKRKFDLETCVAEIGRRPGTTWLLLTHFRNAEDTGHGEARQLLERLQDDEYGILKRVHFMRSGAYRVRAPSEGESPGGQ